MAENTPAWLVGQWVKSEDTAVCCYFTQVIFIYLFINFKREQPFTFTGTSKEKERKNCNYWLIFFPLATGECAEWDDLTWLSYEGT